MTILTMARYEWFEEWAGTRAKHRGPDYQRYKLAIAQRLLERALQRFPHLRDKVTWGGHATGVPNHGGYPAGMVRGGDGVFCRDLGGVCRVGVLLQGWGSPQGWAHGGNGAHTGDGVSHGVGVPKQNWGAQWE